MTAPSFPDVHVLVPAKLLSAAKSRLRGAADAGRGDADAHAELVAAVVLDTVIAACAARYVTGVTVVTADPRLRAELRACHVETLGDEPAGGLNAALHHGARVLARRGVRRIGALQADLPALRPAELDLALASAGGERAFCPDRYGTGTTLLLTAPEAPLWPRFGPDSARQHRRSGARTLLGPWPTLRCDVDTTADLQHAASLGIGTRTGPLLPR